MYVCKVVVVIYTFLNWVNGIVGSNLAVLQLLLVSIIYWLQIKMICNLSYIKVGNDNNIVNFDIKKFLTDWNFDSPAEKRPGLPDGLFSNQKFQFRVSFGGP
jgi:hypothetical protein